MSKRLDENLGTVDYDGLIVTNEPVADVFTVTIRKGGKVQRLPSSAALFLPSPAAPLERARWSPSAPPPQATRP